MSVLSGVLDELEAVGALTRKTNGDILLAVHVQPGAKRTEYVGPHGDRAKIRLAAPPVDGKANQALIAWVATQFGVRKRDVSVIRGLASRQKVVSVQSSPTAQG